jgi:hypothetical protein
LPRQWTVSSIRRSPVSWASSVDSQSSTSKASRPATRIPRRSLILSPASPRKRRPPRCSRSTLPRT